ncbi:acyl-ACP desaturase [Deinococcus hopiensis]|nr:acyl-ACP desaturase [Deinococcus hopiensis]
MTDRQLTLELEEHRPPVSPHRLSRQERERLIQRSFHSLYRWYTSRSQSTRNWNPDTSFDWSAFHTNHSPEVVRIIEGFYAVEQYAPDYTYELIRLVRRGYGRSHFTLRWGSEEEKHADLWRNALLFSRARSPEWIEDYTDELRRSAWTTPWEDPIRTLLYTVLQERATQVNYLNLARIARGEGKGALRRDVNPILAELSHVIAVDEAAHFNFFLEGARLYMYYFPEETLSGLKDVLQSFVMPAANIVPNYESFVQVLYDADVFGKRKYARDVVKYALEQLGVKSLKALDAGVHQSRQVPGEDGALFETRVPDALNMTFVEESLERLFGRLQQFEANTYLDRVSPSTFVRVVW